MRKEKTELISDMQDKLFEKEGKGWFRVVSGSMHPLIEINEKVLVKKVDPSKIRPGDVILFKSHDVFVTHRVMKIFKGERSNLILQKGDASLRASLIPPESIIGKVVTIDKKGKLLSLESRWCKVVNSFLGVQCSIVFRFGEQMNDIKHWLRNKPGFIFLRILYRILSKSIRFTNSTLLRFLTRTT